MKLATKRFDTTEEGDNLKTMFGQLSLISVFMQ